MQMSAAATAVLAAMLHASDCEVQADASVWVELRTLFPESNVPVVWDGDGEEPLVYLRAAE